MLAVVPSQVKPLGQAVHTLYLTYLVWAHAVAVVPSQVEPLGQAMHSSSLTYWSAAHLMVSVPEPPYKEQVENAAMVFGMDAGDADVEVDVGALDVGERVIAVAALRVREASTRASGRARADEAKTDGDPGWTRETLT